MLVVRLFIETITAYVFYSVWFYKQTDWRTLLAATFIYTNGYYIAFGHNMFFHYKLSHERGTAARRAGVQ